MSTPEPSWDLYGAFLAVIQHRSLSGASRALGVTQPTVRRQIESLESQLGVALFTRSPNGLLPTELAKATVPHAEAIAASARAFVRATSAPADREAGTVRLTASEMIGAEVLPAMLTRLSIARPEIQVELVLDDRNQDLLRRESDVAVRMIAPTQKGLVQRRAGAIELGFFASESYVARRGVPTSLSALSSHRLIGPDRSRAMLDGLAAVGLALSPRDFALRTDSTIAQLAAVRAGLGVGVAQLPLALAPVPLVRVLPRVRFTLEAWVVTHEDLKNVARVRVVTDHLANELAAYAKTPTDARGTSRAPATRRA
ncbi:MAG: LysR family transcriptional regulator [Deltaproteobacteria bacterium]|nr:LysR family transcriptional regulator [Deltaproteobacteria bacterium]